MKSFKGFFIFNWKQFFNFRNGLLLLCFTVIALILVQNGVSRYWEIVQTNEEVTRFEREDASTIENITVYGTLGVRLKATPPGIFAFCFNSGLYGDIGARIDCGHGLDLFRYMQGKDGLKETVRSYADFWGWLHLLGSLVVLFYGMDTFRRMNFFKSLVTVLSLGRVFFYTVLSRFIVILVLFLGIMGLSVLWVILNGVVLTGQDWLHLGTFVLTWIVVFWVYYICGILTGLLRKRSMSLTLVIILWVWFIYLYPLAVNKVTSVAADKMTSNALVTSQKWKVLDDYEKRASKEYGKQYPKQRNEDPELKRLILSFLEREHKDIVELESNVRIQMQENCTLNHLLSALVPSTLFNIVSSDISGTGFQSMIDFYGFAQQRKKEFFLYFMKRKYWDDRDIQSFVKESENLFLSQSHWPKYNILGLVLCGVYGIVLLALNFYGFQRRIYFIHVEKLDRKQLLHLPFEPGKLEVAESCNRATAEVIYTFLGNRLPRFVRDQIGITFEFHRGLIQGKDMSQGINYMYICPPNQLPVDLRVKDFLNFFLDISKVKKENRAVLLERYRELIEHSTRISALCNAEKAQLLLMLPFLKEATVYFFHDVATGLTSYFAGQLREVMKTLTVKGASVFYLTRDVNVRSTCSRKGNLMLYHKWSEDIDLMTEFEKNFKES